MFCTRFVLFALFYIIGLHFHTATSTKYSSAAFVTSTEGQTDTVWIGEVTCDLENTLNSPEVCDRLKYFKSMACPNKCSNDLGYGLTFEIHIKWNISIYATVIFHHWKWRNGDLWISVLRLKYSLGIGNQSSPVSDPGPVSFFPLSFLFDVTVSGVSGWAWTVWVLDWLTAPSCCFLATLQTNDQDTSIPLLRSGTERSGHALCC